MFPRSKGKEKKKITTRKAQGPHHHSISYRLETAFTALGWRNPEPNPDKGPAALPVLQAKYQIHKDQASGGAAKRDRPPLSFLAAPRPATRITAPSPQRPRAPGPHATATRHAARPEATPSFLPRTSRPLGVPGPAPPRALTGEQDVRKLHSPPSQAASASAHAPNALSREEPERAGGRVAVCARGSLSSRPRSGLPTRFRRP